MLKVVFTSALDGGFRSRTESGWRGWRGDVLWGGRFAVAHCVRTRRRRPDGDWADALLPEAALKKKKGSMAVIGAFRGESPAGIAGKTIVVIDLCA